MAMSRLGHFGLVDSIGREELFRQRKLSGRIAAASCGNYFRIEMLSSATGTSDHVTSIAFLTTQQHRQASQSLEFC
jgi:hypothetical protein